MSYDPNSLPVGGDDGQEYWSLGRDAPAKPAQEEEQPINESPLKVTRATKERVVGASAILACSTGEYIQRLPDEPDFRTRVEAAKEALLDGSDEAMLAYLRGETKAA